MRLARGEWPPVAGRGCRDAVGPGQMRRRDAPRPRASARGISRPGGFPLTFNLTGWAPVGRCSLVAASTGSTQCPRPRQRRHAPHHGRREHDRVGPQLNHRGRDRPGRAGFPVSFNGGVESGSPRSPQGRERGSHHRLPRLARSPGKRCPLDHQCRRRGDNPARGPDPGRSGAVSRRHSTSRRRSRDFVTVGASPIRRVPLSSAHAGVTRNAGDTPLSGVLIIGLATSGQRRVGMAGWTLSEYDRLFRDHPPTEPRAPHGNDLDQIARELDRSVGAVRVPSRRSGAERPVRSRRPWVRLHAAGCGHRDLFCPPTAPGWGAPRHAAFGATAASGGTAADVDDATADVDDASDEVDDTGRGRSGLAPAGWILLALDGHARQEARCGGIAGRPLEEEERVFRGGRAAHRIMGADTLDLTANPLAHGCIVVAGPRRREGPSALCQGRSGADPGARKGSPVTRRCAERPVRSRGPG
jgi:hypothetical protein